MLSEQQNLNQTMLDSNQLTSLQQAINSYSPLQLAWASGYLAAKSENVAIAAVPAATAATTRLTILYASQTGNAKGFAAQLADNAKAAGIVVNLSNISDYKAKALKSETHLLIVASTNGEGEPPDDAIEFHDFLHSKKAPKLPSLQYSVLALGDSSYEFFCQTGKDFDERLLALGANRVFDRVDCDLDYESEANSWSNKIIAQLKDELTQSSNDLAPVIKLPLAVSSTSQYSKQNPYAAELLVSQKITGRDSNKDVRHVEIDLEDSGLSYQPGDALGVWFENDAVLVDNLLLALSLTADEQVSLDVTNKQETVSVRDALIAKLEITQTAPAFVEFWAQRSGSTQLLSVIENKNATREFAATHQVIDIVGLAKAEISAQEFVDSLRKLTPRLYSIASSQDEVDEEVHLTVGLVSFEHNEQQRQGGASGYLADRLQAGSRVKVFVEHNNNFRLPEDPALPVIMIGPGTGVAPFRAFMQQREAQQGSGDNWMFFGEQTFTQDFLYQVEWQNYLKSGLLTRMDVAFSRDQEQKVYVQDRMKQQASELFAWLERGAHLYICGDANKMAKDVHQTLLDIIVEQGQKTVEQAEAYLKSLRSSKRYQKDVY